VVDVQKLEAEGTVDSVLGPCFVCGFGSAAVVTGPI